jgi:hypothetical protein
MSRLLYKSGIPSDAKLETVTRNGEWVSPGARSDDMVAVQGAICSTIQLGRTVQHGLIVLMESIQLKVLGSYRGAKKWE